MTAPHPTRTLGTPANSNGGGADPVLSNYESIRSRFQTMTSDTAAVSGPQIVPTNGKFYRSSTDYQVLSGHVAGFDRLFLTLINGIVEDPDYALRKDPQIYQRMLRDPQIYYCLMVRKTATSSLPWQVTPPDEFAEDATAQQLAEAANARIKRIPQFRELLNSLLNALLPGLALIELLWKVDETGQYVVAHHFPKDKDRFKFHKDGGLQLLSRESPVWGTKVPDYKFITHRFQVRDGAWARPEDAGYVYYGQGLADTPLYHYFYFKVTAMRFMLKNLERNSSPFKVYYTGPQNATLASKLDQIMAALQNDSVVGIPGKKGETNVDVAPARGGAELYVGLIDYIDRLITRAILGQELMTEMPSVGSYAAAQVHASVFAKITENDRDLLQDTLNNTLMKYDATLNTPQVPEAMRPVFRFKSSAVADVATFLTTVQQAMSLGLRVSEPQVRDLCGLREPGPNEAALNDMAMAAQAQQMAMQSEMAPEDESDPNSPTNKGRAIGAADQKKKDKKKAKSPSKGK